VFALFLVLNAVLILQCLSNSGIDMIWGPPYVNTAHFFRIKLIFVDSPMRGLFYSLIILLFQFKLRLGSQTLCLTTFKTVFNTFHLMAFKGKLFILFNILRYAANLCSCRCTEILFIVKFVQVGFLNILKAILLHFLNF
jgi:hypothetical protein